VSVPEHALSSEELRREAYAIRDREDTKRAMAAMTNAHQKTTIFLLDPPLITELMTRKDETVSLSHIAEYLFSKRKDAIEEYQWRLDNEPDSLRSDGWSEEAIRKEMGEYHKRFAEAELRHEVLEKAYLRVAEKAGCASQLSLLFRKQREEQRDLFAGLG